MKKTSYNITTDKSVPPLRIAVVCDLHEKPYDRIVEMLTDDRPDFIAAPGDILLRLDLWGDEREAIPEHFRDNNPGFEALRTFASIAPTFYCPGNHDLAGRRFMRCHNNGISPRNLAAIRDTGVTVLDNSSADFRGIKIGGLSSALFTDTGIPDLAWLADFDSFDGFKFLLCHHPEYYPQYISGTGVDLTVSGHAHGGQWRLFGLSAYAPGQGIFPKYTSGVYENRLVVSRGLANHTVVPRIFNSTELVYISINRN